MSQRSRVPGLVMTSLLAGVATLAGCVDDPQDAEPVPTGQTQQAGGAPLTCVNWSMSGQGALGGPNIVNATCLNTASIWVNTSLWMPGCLGNFNGRMGWARDGFFDRSCKDCRLVISDATHILLGCNCFTQTGALSGAGIDMNDLTNANGALVCPI